MEKAKKGLTLDTFLEYCLIMLLITAIAYIGNWIYSDFGLMESLPGILILLAIAFVGYTLSELIPFNILWCISVLWACWLPCLSAL